MAGAGGALKSSDFIIMVLASVAVRIISGILNQIMTMHQ